MQQSHNALWVQIDCNQVFNHNSQYPCHSPIHVTRRSHPFVVWKYTMRQWNLMDDSGAIRRSRATTDLAASTFLISVLWLQVCKGTCTFPTTNNGHRLLSVAFKTIGVVLVVCYLLQWIHLCRSETSVSVHHCACTRIDWLSDLKYTGMPSTGTYSECWRRSITLVSFQISVVECSTAVLTAALDF